MFAASPYHREDAIDLVRFATKGANRTYRDLRQRSRLSLVESCSRRNPMTDELMTATQAATLRKLAQDAYELDAFKPNSPAPRRTNASQC